jgi:hypothetical protein
MSMLSVDHDKWGQSVSDLRETAVASSHQRTRERFMALYEVADGKSNATSWAVDNGRHFQSVQAWIHVYNEYGPEALCFQHTGGRLPLLTRRPAS